jgi:hypothetical protein
MIPEIATKAPVTIKIEPESRTATSRTMKKE